MNCVRCCASAVRIPVTCMRQQGCRCHCCGPLTANQACVSCIQDLFGRSQKAEKKAKICMHTGTFVYHFKGQSS